MEWLALAIAVYGAALSSLLGYLAWRKDRHSLRFFSHFSRRHDWYGLHISVVNVGFRPIILESVTFEQPGAGYLNDLEGDVELPLRLDEGEQAIFPFHAEDIEPDTTAFVVRDTHRRVHKMEFTASLWEAFQGFKEHVEETQPDLVAKGRERPAAELRRVVTPHLQSKRNI